MHTILQLLVCVRRAGLFLAPQTVGEALKGGRLLAAVASRCGILASPPLQLNELPDPPSYITALRLGSREAMLAFCGAVQAASPMGSYITPTPGDHTIEPALPGPVQNCYDVCRAWATEREHRQSAAPCKQHHVWEAAGFLFQVHWLPLALQGVVNRHTYRQASTCLFSIGCNNGSFHNVLQSVMKQ